MTTPRLRFLCLALIFIALASSLHADDNLIRNAGFEDMRFGRPQDWDALPAGAKIAVSGMNVFEGDQSLLVSLDKPGTAGAIQRVTVKPDTLYRLGVKIKTEGLVAKGPGAHLYVATLNALSNDFTGTSDGWQAATLTVKTEPGQTFLDVAVRVGARNLPATGRAWFDSFTMEEAAAMPAAGLPEAATTPFPWPLLVFALAAGLVLGLFAFLYRKKRVLPKAWLLDLILAGGLTAAYAFIAFFNLGSFDAPQTYYRAEGAGEGFVIDLGERVPVAKVNYFLALGEGSYDLEFSNDNAAWRDRQTIAQENQYSMIEWRTLKLETTARFLRVTATKPGAMLGEIGVFRRDSLALVRGATILPANGRLKPITDPAAVIDEPERVPAVPSCLNSMYFDETYHARAAYEYTLGRDSSETTHPPLGKLTIGAGILAFGFTPFGWRFAGTLFGVLMVPVMYAFGLALFKKREFAFVAAFLFAFDFMHFVQTRIATIDVYGVFWIMLMFYFAYRALQENPFARKPKRFLLFLALAGLSLGVGAASKWIALYGAVGLAVILFVFMIYRTVTHIRAFGRKLSGAQAERQAEDAEIEIDPHRAAINFAGDVIGRLALLVLFCGVVFVVVPAVIYFASYIPFLQARMPLYPYTSPLELVWNEQKFMYDYHATLNATHPFSSPWYEWPVMARPIWYYSGKPNLPPGFTSSIAAFGNPAVWWPGIVAAAIALVAGVWRAVKRKEGAGLFIIAALAAQYLPWIVIPRKLTFIYHFFAAVPFLVFAIVYVLKLAIEKWPKARWTMFAYLAVVLALFLLFYPVLSGLVIDQSFVDTILRWFPGWVF